MSSTGHDDDSVKHEKKHGEGWVVTFADMMALLMSFFVLLLSFSEQDAAKFKEVGGSLEQAFGVQRDIVAYQMPKGTSIVAREFSPGKPKPTAVNEVRQKTIDDMAQTLEFDPREQPKPKETKLTPGLGAGESIKPKKSTLEISEKLAKEILEGKIEIEKKHQRIIIRIMDQGTFAPGDDSIHPVFEPILDKIADLLDSIPGNIAVTGHTDDKPISNNRFRSNWELSAKRAISVAHELYERGVAKERLMVSGFADTEPLVPNDTEAHRSKNRRVEIIINQKDKPEQDVVPDSVEATPGYSPLNPKEIKVNNAPPKSPAPINTPKE